MDKMLKKKGELEHLALEEMRHAGLERLEQVTIRTDPDGVWFIAPRDETAQFDPDVQRAAVNAQIKLRPKYDLDPED